MWKLLAAAARLEIAGDHAASEKLVEPGMRSHHLMRAAASARAAF